MSLDLKAIKKDSFDITTDTAPGKYFESTTDGHKIYYRIWKPTGPIKAQAIYFHGIGEHIERYDATFTKYAANGILIRGMDWRGHGRTVKSNKNGIQGYATSFEQVQVDMLQLYNLDIDGVSKDLPTFVFGHSMGGLLALVFTKNHHKSLRNFRGVIAQAPALAPGNPPPPALKFVVRSVGKLIPKLTQPSNLDATGINSSEAEVEAYLRDPLNHGVISVEVVNDMYDAAEDLKRSAADFKFPLIMYHSSIDKLTNAAASKEYFATVGSSDKIYHQYEADLKLGHEIHNEPSVKDSIVGEYTAWMLERA
ncbi:hypothetical protein HDU79_007605 [Rhizoclosmatium sp. JEL0117]|nr:hypothetical protein HDU79_007605 [Rhizoclosmatium sp. JEL0117]